MEQEPMTSNAAHDVAVLGSGLVGSMLAAILARNGAKVVLVDEGTHPRSALGESTVPYTPVALRVLAERYRVPEIKSLVSFANSTRTLGPKHGVRKHLGFLHHRENRPQNPTEVLQFSVTPGVQYDASHLYRQDADAHMFYAAIGHGATPRQNFPVADIAVEDDGVTLTGTSGETLRARFLVDATGQDSPLARTLQLREEPTRFTHQSRTIWNHMVGVPRTDELFRHPSSDTPPVPWYEGTVHHVFEHGWFWVIPFDNHPGSRNPLCSVGLTLDAQRHPRPADMTPEEEFFHHASRFPDVVRQFTGARPVREWEATDRLQYSSRECAGDRWFLLGEAAGFVDPLFSQSLCGAADTVDALAWRLLDTLADDRFSRQRFAYPELLQQKYLDVTNDLVNAAYVSWADHDLWSAVFRIWAFGANIGAARRYNALDAFLKDGNDRGLKEAEDVPHPGLPWPDHDGYHRLVEEAIGQCEAFRLGKVTGREAADALYLRIGRADFVPKHLGFAERQQRFIHPGPPAVAKMMRWLLNGADISLRKVTMRHNAVVAKSRLKGRKVF
ncbi:NAD(P)/FAD-dependent oxidoreductase [Streptomyces johnsoniae]|uniref:Tryptophan 7-halogenase n=1 Tax=Streptomyces johnsoniae TaxID=3075532 RepID=A0ABU2S0F4_9ACTN|nr:tryptophan 7-halogenase [Streptomyces sp. DSM 41886]MDT0441060.1 tryptophan 7-halogenase [Streptomyces sp. DSM 41886]